MFKSAMVTVLALFVLSAISMVLGFVLLVVPGISFLPAVMVGWVIVYFVLLLVLVLHCIGYTVVFLGEKWGPAIPIVFAIYIFIALMALGFGEVYGFAVSAIMVFVPYVVITIVNVLLLLIIRNAIEE